MIFVNKTPHNINLILGEKGVAVLVLPDEQPIRLPEVAGKTEEIDGIKITEVSLSPTELPPPIEGTYYIVSQPVAMVAADRNDFVFPYPLVRNDKGQVIGCRGFGKYKTTNKRKEA